MSQPNSGAARPATDGWQTKLARLITEAFAPVVLIFLLLIVVSIHATGQLRRGLAIGLLAAFFGGGLPYAVLLIGVRSGRLGDRHLSRREERPLMMLMGLVCVSCGLLLMRWMDAPREVYALVAAMVAGVAVALAITLFWKISIHTACTAGSVAIATLTFGTAWIWSSFFIAAVAWARHTLREHSASQLVVGAFVGAIVASICWSHI